MLLAEAVLEWPGLKRLRERCEVRCGRGMIVGKLAGACLSSLGCLGFEEASNAVDWGGSAVQERGSWDKMRVGRCQVARRLGWHWVTDGHCRRCTGTSRRSLPDAR